MKIKFNLLCLFLILCILFSISSVAASEDIATVDVLNSPQLDVAVSQIDGDEMALGESSNDNGLKSTDVDALKEDSTYSFSDLAEKINSQSEGNLTIGGRYVYDESKDSAYKNGIVINKDRRLDDEGNSIENSDYDFSIIGENLIIDGNNQARAFQITGLGNITLINITFINCYNEGNGGAVYATGNASINNSRFENNHAANGGAIYYSPADVGEGQNINFTVYSSNFTSSSDDVVSYGNISLIQCNIEGNISSFGYAYIAGLYSNGSIVCHGDSYLGGGNFRYFYNDHGTSYMGGGWTNSTIINDGGSMNMSFSLINGTIKNIGGFMNISSCSFSGGNFTNINGTIVSSGYFYGLNFTNDGGNIIFRTNTSYLDNEGNEVISVYGAYLGNSNITNKGYFIIGNYLGENNITNYGDFVSGGSYSSNNNITNYANFNVTPQQTTNYFSGGNIVNYGNFSAINTTSSNSPLGNISNYGNMEFEGVDFNSTMEYILKNYADLKITSASVVYGNFYNLGGNASIINATVRNGQNVSNVEGYMYSENIDFGGTKILNGGSYDFNNCSLGGVIFNNTGNASTVGGSYGGGSFYNYGSYSISDCNQTSGLSFNNNNGTLELNNSHLWGGAFYNYNNAGIMTGGSNLTGASFYNYMGSIHSAGSDFNYNNIYHYAGCVLNISDCTAMIVKIDGTGSVIFEGENKIINDTNITRSSILNTGDLTVNNSYFNYCNFTNEGFASLNNTQHMGNVSNSGIFNMNGSALVCINPYSDIAIVSNNGTINISNAFLGYVDFKNDNGSLYLDGCYSSMSYYTVTTNVSNTGDGFVSISNAALSNYHFDNEDGVIDIENATITSSGLDSSKDGTFNLLNCSVSLTGATTRGNINVENSSISKVNLYNKNNGNISFNGENTLDHAFIGGGNIINNGVLSGYEIEYEGSDNMGSGLKNHGSIVANNFTFNQTDIENDGNISLSSSTINGDIRNEGNISLSSSAIEGDIINDGSLILSDSSINGSFISNNGELNLTKVDLNNSNMDNGGIADLTDSTFANGNIDNEGTLNLNGSSIDSSNLTNKGDFNAEDSNISDVEIINQGNLSVDGGNVENTEVFNDGGNISGSNSDISSNVKNVDSIVASNIVTYYESGVFFSANFTDSYGNPLVNEKVVFKFNGKTFDLTTDSNGMAALYRQLSAGKYDVELVNPSSGQSENYTFEILKIPVKLTVNKVVENYGARKYLSIKVVDSKGKAVSGIALTVKYNGKTYTFSTKYDGVLKIKLQVLKVGTYDVSISSPSPKYDVPITKTSIKVNKAKTTVKAPKITAKAKKSKYFKIAIKSKVTKKAVKKVKIKVKVYTSKKYKVYKLKTNKKGIAKFNVKKLKKGTHKVIISSLNKNYKISKKSSIRIK